MNQPYVYRLTWETPVGETLYYIGCKFSNACPNQLFNQNHKRPYRTSSPKVWHLVDLVLGNPTEIEIWLVDDKKSALELENELMTKHKIKEDIRSLNMFSNEKIKLSYSPYQKKRVKYINKPKDSIPPDISDRRIPQVAPDCS